MKLHMISGKERSLAPSGSLRRLPVPLVQMSNRNIAQFRNSVNSRRMKIYVISNRNKSGAYVKSVSADSLRSRTEAPSLFASGFASAYHEGSMPMSFRKLWIAVLAVLLVCSFPLYAGDSPEIIPMSAIEQVKKGGADS